MQTSCSYPDLVNEELKKYDGEVCKYFQVDRRPSVVSRIRNLVGKELIWILILDFILTGTSAAFG